MTFIDYYQSVANSVIELLANSLLPAILLVIIIQFFILIQARRNASTRYGLWFGTLVLVLLLPVFITFVDLTPISNGLRISNSNLVRLDPPSSERVAPIPVRSLSQFSAGASKLETIQEPIFSAGSPIFTEPHTDQSESLLFRLPANLGSYAFLAWIVGSLVLLIRLSQSYSHMQRLKTSSHSLGDHPLISLIKEPYSMRKQRKIEIGISTIIDSPAAVGLFRPMILLPQSFLTRFSEEQLEQIIYHEAAHLRRWDDWTKLLQEFSQAILFFNPVVWWIGHKLDLNREIACDDWVMVETNNDWHGYSDCLLKVLEAVQLKNNAPASASLMMAKSRIESRIKRLVTQERPTTSMSFMGVFPLFLIFAAVLLLGNPIAVGFDRYAVEKEKLTLADLSVEPLKQLSGVRLTNLRSNGLHNVFIVPTSIGIPMQAVETFQFDDEKTTLIGRTFEIVIESDKMQMDMDGEFLFIDFNGANSAAVLSTEQFSSTGFSNVIPSDSSDEIFSSAWLATDSEALSPGEATRFAPMGLLIISDYGLKIKTQQIRSDEGHKITKAFLTPILENDSGGESGGLQ